MHTECNSHLKCTKTFFWKELSFQIQHVVVHNFPCIQTTTRLLIDYLTHLFCKKLIINLNSDNLLPHSRISHIINQAGIVWVENIKYFSEQLFNGEANLSIVPSQISYVIVPSSGFSSITQEANRFHNLIWEKYVSSKKKKRFCCMYIQ